MFDVSNLKAVDDDALEAGIEMDLLDPFTGEPTGAVWKIASYDSPAYKIYERKVRNEGLKAFQKGKLKAANTDENTIKLLATLVVGWTGMGDKNKSLEHCLDEVIAMFKLPLAGENFMEQVDSVAKDNEAFFKASQKTSAMPLDIKLDT